MDVSSGNNKEQLAIAHGRNQGFDKLMCLSPALLRSPKGGLVVVRVIHMSDARKIIDINPSTVHASNTSWTLGSGRIKDLSFDPRGWV